MQILPLLLQCSIILDGIFDLYQFVSSIQKKGNFENICLYSHLIASTNSNSFIKLL